MFVETAHVACLSRHIPFDVRFASHVRQASLRGSKETCLDT